MRERSRHSSCWKNASPVKYWKVAVIDPAFPALLAGEGVD